MLKRDKRSFTDEEQRECWQLWRQGLGFSDIARELGSKPGTILGVIRLNGGYSPPQHTRNKQHLTLICQSASNIFHLSACNFFQLFKLTSCVF